MINKPARLLLCFLLPGRLLFGGDLPDSAVVARITDEGMNRSEVGKTLELITDVYGPRLTWSPGYRTAAGWAVQRMEEIGLSNCHLEGCEPIGRGWELERYNAQVIGPRPFPLISFPKAWSPETRGTVRGSAIYVDAQSDSALATFRGKLRGKFVLLSEQRAIALPFNGDAKRLTDEDLLDLANSSLPEERRRRRFELTDEQKAKRMLSYETELMAQEEGALALLSVGRGDKGNIFVQQATVPSHPDTPWTSRAVSWKPDAPEILPQIVVTADHYNRILRMLARGIDVRLEVGLNVKTSGPDSVYNIIGEIPGSDLADQVVMIGAHFDSWHGSTGATDNGTGSAICLEVMRILKATGLQPRRTIRVALWGGEEQGLLGSEAYVTRHFGELTGPDSDRVTRQKPAAQKFSVYFNLDNGAGKIRGVYQQANEAVGPLFREWLKPFSEMGASTLTLKNTGGTDHLSFDRIGLPGFEFIQDPLEYGTMTHHSIMDDFDRTIEDDLKQASVIMATFTYNAAMSDEMIPRKATRNVVIEGSPEVQSSTK